MLVGTLLDAQIGLVSQMFRIADKYLTGESQPSTEPTLAHSHLS
jgi:hypothetical protein